MLVVLELLAKRRDQLKAFGSFAQQTVKLSDLPEMLEVWIIWDAKAYPKAIQSYILRIFLISTSV